MGDWYDKHLSSSFGAERSSSVKAKPSGRRAALLAAQPIKPAPSGPMERYNALDAESKNDVLAYGLLTFAVGALGATIINSSMSKRAIEQVRTASRLAGRDEGREEALSDYFNEYRQYDSEGFKIPFPGEDPDGNWVRAVDTDQVKREVDRMEQYRATYPEVFADESNLPTLHYGTPR